MALAAKNRQRAIYEYRSWTESGKLVSYGPVLSDSHRQLAECADKILRGAKPADLPRSATQQVRFDHHVRTAKALGLTIPPSLLARADQIIE